jgi:ADP-glucose pyrophosphorylase
MNNVSIISYPSHRDEALLSLTDLRSKYMIPFAARFRVADFALRNAAAVSAKRRIIFSNVLDDLTEYVHHHPNAVNNESVSTKVYLETRLSVAQCARALLAKPTAFYIIYNGDCPCIIDFEPALKKFKLKNKGGALLLMLDYNGRPSMARTALLCDRKSLEAMFTKAIKEKDHSPHIFEMIINKFVMKGIRKDVIGAYLHPLSNIPEYYHSNYEALRDKNVSSIIFDDKYLKSGMHIGNHTFLGQGADVSSSHIAEGCMISGTVVNSILFPGTVISERAEVRDSIILPYGRIGSYAKISRSVIDEFTDRSRTDFPCNISEYAEIGGGEDGLKNADHSESLFDGITLIGKNCVLPERLRIGSAGYIASGVGFAPFASSRIVDDGISILNPIDNTADHEHN